MTLLTILILIALSLVLTFYPWRVENPFCGRVVSLKSNRIVQCIGRYGKTVQPCNLDAARLLGGANPSLPAISLTPTVALNLSRMVVGGKI